jgi:hypothetical protein
MKIVIEMAADLKYAKNSKIHLVSPNYKKYELDAEAVFYRNRNTANGRVIPQFNLQVETDGAVEYEAGDFLVWATAELETYNLASEKLLMKLV